GPVQTCWTVRLLAAVLLSRFRLDLSPSSVRRHLKAGGWRWGRPRLAPATHAPGRQRRGDAAAATKLKLIERPAPAAAAVPHLGGGRRRRALLRHQALPPPASDRGHGRTHRQGRLKTVPYFRSRA